MATSSPPSDATSPRVTPPKTRSSAGSLFPSLADALNLIETVRDAGLVFAPAMPEPQALEAAARQAGVSTKAALTIYLTILKYDK